MVLVKDGVETEVGELLWEVMWWDLDHAELRSLCLCNWIRQSQGTRNEVWSILLNVLVKDDLVHGLTELLVNFFK